jgi:hypothetical protein
VAKEANLSTIFTSDSFKACPMGKVLLLTPSQGGPDRYVWDSSGLSDASVFSLSLRARDATEDVDGGSGSGRASTTTSDGSSSKEVPVVQLTGDGPIRRKPLSMHMVVLDGAGLSMSAEAAFTSDAGASVFDSVSFQNFASSAINVTGDNSVKVLRSGFSSPATMPYAQYSAKTGRAPALLHVHRGSLVSQDNRFFKALVRAGLTYIIYITYINHDCVCATSITSDQTRCSCGRNHHKSGPLFAETALNTSWVVWVGVVVERRAVRSRVWAPPAR